MKTKNTIVNYTKDGVKYSHTIAGRKTRAQVEQVMIMELHVGRSAIKEIVYR